jgi:hypothetical protein
VYQEKCLPSPITDDCPESFWTNEDGYCFPVNENGNWVCPEGYHDIDDDESGQCYPIEEGCPEGTVMTNDENNCIDENTCRNFSNARECVDKETHCNLYPDSEYCRSDDRDDCQPHLIGSRCKND